MPKRARELPAVQVKRLTKPGMHAVGGVAGLLLQVTTTGARSWILRATVGAKRRDIGLGAFPDVPLKDARQSARELRAKIREGIDPVVERRDARLALIAAQTRRIDFAEATKKKHAAIADEFRTDKGKRQWLAMMERHAFPVLGTMDVADIELEDVQRALKPIWYTHTATAKKVRQRIESVLTWATVKKHRHGPNPASWGDNLKVVMTKPSMIHTTIHQRAIPWENVPDFMERLRKRGGQSAKALEFAILTAARSGEVRRATWDEIDMRAKVWTVPKEHAKNNNPHKVPLSGDALALLRKLPRFEGSNVVFASARGGPLSDMSLSAITRKMKVDAVPHGFRSSFKDWARSMPDAPRDEVSELALSHVNSDATRAAYARDELMPKRKIMMQQWAEFCRHGLPTATVHEISEARA